MILKCNKIKKAFSLAETLITVVILGILGAITVTSVIKNCQKTQTLTKLKKTYSAINQAIDISVIENGPADTWQGTPQERIRNYIIPYFKVKEVITMPESRSKSGNKFYQISGKQETGLGIVRTLYDDRSLAIYLKDNTQIWIFCGTIAITFYVDLNGPKKPNTYGKDMFSFVYYINDNYFDFSSACDNETVYVEKSINDLKTGTPCRGLQYGCNKNGRGMWCGALIEASGWKFPKDYPW